MKRTIFLLATSLCWAQRPADPTLVIPQDAPELMASVDDSPFTMPEGVSMVPPAAVAFDAKGHIYVLSRGKQALFEFDADRKYIRSFGDGLLTRAHGLRIDRDGNIWVTDVGGHVALKLNPKGEVLLTLGVKGEAGEWNEAAGSRKLNQPNDIAFAPNGDVFISQGHTAGGADPRVLKFDKNGKFLLSWGGRGTELGKFTAAHGLALDARGLLWVVDRENQRIEIFDQNGKFQREIKYAGLPCSLAFGAQNIYMVNGFAGQLLKLDLDGKVLAATGKPGKGANQYGEAHFVNVSPRGEIFTADTVNGVMQRYVVK
jgi:sugar lactone lactonase YvrE